MKGKNKLVPRLMGITRESVMRLDERTKDIMKVWPLTSVKRWAASPKSFTLVSLETEVFQQQFKCTVIFLCAAFKCLLLQKFVTQILSK